MKVGLIMQPSDPEVGGAHTFLAEVARCIEATAEGRHNFVILSSDHVDQMFGSHPQAKDGSKTSLQLAVAALGVDLVWFPTPANFREPGVPFVFTVWDLQHRLQPFFPEVSVTGWTWDQREATYGTLLPRAARIVTGTKTGKDEIVRFYAPNPDNVSVIPFPTPTFPIPELADVTFCESLLDSAPSFLLYPAQFWPHKNHANLLHAFERLTSHNSKNLSLVLPGSDKGNLGYIKGLVSELGLDEKVVFPGFVSRSVLRCLYERAEALVFPSFFGPDNLPPLEAFSLECPVVAADVAGAYEQLGAAAEFFDPSDPEDLAASVAKVMSDPKLRVQMIERGLAVAKASTAETYARSMLGLIDDLVPFWRTWERTYRHS